MKTTANSHELYSEVYGEGADIILLHGWGMHGGIWGRFKELLAENFKTHVLDLPGYGFSQQMKNEFDLDSITVEVERYIKSINKPVVVSGWSLGGLIALNLLKRKNINICKIVLIAASPCFTKKDNWNDAMDLSVFNTFAAELHNDYKKTIKRFLSLQTRGSESARDELRLLNDKIFERGEPDMQALKKGLDILSETDVRDIREPVVPALLILGDKDTLVPVTVMTEFKKMFPHNEHMILEKTGHAPFIFAAEKCAESIKKFIHAR